MNDTKPLNKKAQAEQDQKDAQNYLRELFAGEVSPTVKTVLRHVSASGMSRDISLFYNGANITWYVARAMGETIKDKFGQRVIRVSGCGMDMGFHLVYNLSYVLYSSTEIRHPSHPSDAGYFLSQEWM